MKTHRLILALLFIAGTFYTANAQKRPVHMQKRETIKVYGESDECKKRIEQSARQSGVSSARWNAKTQVLTVTYDLQNTNSEKIQRYVANAGHDTQRVTASIDAFNSLPASCRYERKKTSGSVAIINNRK